ncbi:PREDICTED: DPY30 domain-containing protein 2-like [Elephantulus edwardii]|uniref:DPY30 domain-containing protein 2-like n=1 Tax=Elephantulus edwardii TaxID=28737 RepID=UPI0003F07DF6|nr:PREDICTED: DPY30 domain-containing protein 2-like [Elephantulus edwardii]
MEIDYLKYWFGNCLADALSEVLDNQPNDPIEYVALWLLRYRYSMKGNEENSHFSIREEDKKSKGNSMEAQGAKTWTRGDHTQENQQEDQIRERVGECPKAQISTTEVPKRTVSIQASSDPREESLEVESPLGYSMTIVKKH